MYEYIYYLTMNQKKFSKKIIENEYDIGFWQMEESERLRDESILRWRKEWDQ